MSIGLVCAQTNNWKLSKRTDKMTDKVVCSLSHVKDQNVFYDDQDVLTISYFKRGGVGGYQYRVDSRPASPYKLTESGSRNSVQIFNRDGELTGAKQLRVSGITVLSAVIDVDLSITGLDAARNQMAKDCGLPPMPAYDGGVKEWPAVPTIN